MENNDKGARKAEDFISKDKCVTMRKSCNENDKLQVLINILEDFLETLCSMPDRLQ